MMKLIRLIRAMVLISLSASSAHAADRTVTVIAVEAEGRETSTVAPLANAKVLVQLESGNVYTGFTDAAGRSTIRFPEESTYVVRVIFGPGVIKFTNRLYGRADQIVSVYSGPEPAQGIDLTDLQALLMSIDEIADGIGRGIPVGLQKQFQSKEIDQALEEAKKELPKEEYESYRHKLNAIREAKALCGPVPAPVGEGHRSHRCIMKRLFRRG